MGTRQQKWRITAVVSALLLVLAACGGSPAEKNEVRFGTDQFPPNLFPYIEAGQGTATAYVMETVLPRVFVLQPDFTFKADSELLTADPRDSLITSPQQQVTYRLSPNAVWTDRNGKTTPITAADLIATWQVNSRAGEFANCHTIASGYDKIEKIESKDNGLTAVVTFKQKYADWPGLFSPFLPASEFPVDNPKLACEHFNKGWSVSSKELAPVSAGPFQVASVDQTAKTTTLTRNEKYWGPKAKLDRIIFRTVASGAQQLSQALRNNEINMAYPQPQIDLVNAIKGIKNVHSESNLGLGMEHIDFNTQNEFLQDVNVRRAIAFALDRSELTRRTIAQFDPNVKVLNNRIFVNNEPGYEDHGGEYSKRDLNQAKALLAQAGFIKGDDGILQRGGKRLSFTFVTTENNRLRTETVDVIQQQLKDVGIEIRPSFRSSDVFFGGPETQGSMASGAFDISLYAWILSPLRSEAEPIYTCPPGPGNRRQNVGMGCDARVDQAIVDSFSALDPKDSIAQWNKIDELLWQDMFTIPIYQKPTFLAYNKNLTGVVDNASTEGPLFEAGKWAKNTATRE